MRKKTPSSFQFDFSVLFGLLGSFAFVFLAIGFYTSLNTFINIPSLLIVFGGSLCASAVCFSPFDIVNALVKIFRLIFGLENQKTLVPSLIMRASEIVHTNGLLALQKNYMPSNSTKSFWYQGVNLLIDGISGTECDHIMRSKMMNDYSAQMNAVSFLNKMAEIAPAMGLIGTLIGLVQMLSTLSDPSTIGPAMAIAMLTTFYGAIFAYLFCLPLASRLEQIAEKNLEQDQLALVGFKALDTAQNPRKTQMELNALLPDNQKINFFES